MSANIKKEVWDACLICGEVKPIGITITPIEHPRMFYKNLSTTIFVCANCIRKMKELVEKSEEEQNA